MTRWIVFAVSLAISAVGHASPAAEKLFQDGRAFMNQGKLAEACDAFRRSTELEPRVGTLLNLANCEEKRGHFAVAWSTFIEARALAKRQNDERAAEADKRAAALAPKLSYLTIKVASRPPQLVVKRNSTDVPNAELDHEVPVDPGTYAVEASAPGHAPYKQSIDIALGSHAVIEIPALTSTGEPPAPEQPGAAPAFTRRYAVGAAFGVSSDKDLIGGLRGVIGITQAGPGVIRLVPSVLYARSQDSMDVYHYFDIVAIALSAEYAWNFTPQFFVAGGLGLGVDVVKDNYANPLGMNGFAQLRLSPTLRVGPVDIGLHAQLVGVTTNRFVGLAELGVDYFFF